MDTKQPEALMLAALNDAETWPGELSIVTFAARSAAELRRQHAEIETLRAGYSAARLEIESLHTQMEAVGAGGMEPLRKRCLHQISEPAQPVALDAARYRFLRDGEWRRTDLESVIRLQLNSLWDSKIDAAIAAQKEGTNG